jgi:predicted transcriptional regulator
LRVGEKFEYEINGQDDNLEDINILNFGLTQAPEGMTIDSFFGILSWTPKVTQTGNHTITVWVSDGVDRTNISFELQVSKSMKGSSFVNAYVITGFSFLILFVAFGSFIGGTEVGKYKFFSLLIVPMYNRLHPKRVMDNFIRGKIIGYIEARPGDNYNKIKFALKLKNGTLTHHTNVLEKEGFISIVRDGFYTRFYPKGTAKKLPKTPIIKEVQEELIDMIRHEPGITQHEMINLIGLDQKVISYNLLQLKRNDMIRVIPNGRENKYYVNPEPPIELTNQVQDQTTN